MGKSAHSPRPDMPFMTPGHVGSLLQEARLRQGHDLRIIADDLRIRYHYLLAIEGGRYDDLPGPTYAAGFVRAYAEYLGLPAEETLRRFRDETQPRANRPAQLDFPTPANDGGMPAGAFLLVALIVAGCAYGMWFWLSSQGKTVADLVPDIPATVADLVGEWRAALPGLDTSAPAADTAMEADADALVDRGTTVANADAAMVSEDAPATDVTPAPIAPALDAPTRVASADPDANVSIVIRDPGSLEALLDAPMGNTATAATTGPPPASTGARRAEAEAEAEAMGDPGQGRDQTPIPPGDPVTGAPVTTADPASASVPQPGAGDPPPTIDDAAGGTPLVASVAPDQNDTAPPAPETNAPETNAPETNGLETVTDSPAAVLDGVTDPAPTPTETEPAGARPTTPDAETSARADAGLAPDADTVAGAGARAGVETDDETDDETGAPGNDQIAVATGETGETGTWATESAPPAPQAPEVPAVPETGETAARPATDPPPEPDAQTEAEPGPEGPEPVPAPFYVGRAAPPDVRAAGEDARIVLRASRDAWIQLRRDGDLVLRRLLRRGDVYAIPAGGGYVLNTSNAGGLEVYVDGRRVRDLGPVGARRNGVRLSPSGLN